MATTIAAPRNSAKMSMDNKKYFSEEGPEGCYLTFEPDSGGRLMLFYSRGEIPQNAIGFWCPGPGRTIQGFKFKQNGGRSELIKGIAGGDQNRRKYFSGVSDTIYFVSLSLLRFRLAKPGTVDTFSPSPSMTVVSIYQIGESYERLRH